MSRRAIRCLLAVSLGLVLVVLALAGPPPALAQSGAPPDLTRREGGFIGAEVCGSCHQAQYQDWLASNHRHAMTPINEAPAGPPFAGESLSYHGRPTTFLRRDGQVEVTTQGADGETTRFPITHSFGHAPLRQYLVPFPGGRLQPLPWAWDARSAAQGGQRWFHLYPDDDITHRDPLHWTGRIQTWNRQCASCHSTDLRKGYDAATDSYRTTAAAVNMTCEACHGPGQRHQAWATGQQPGDPDRGLSVSFSARAGGAWTMDDGRGIARWQGPPRPAALTDSCAGCHSRRRQVTADARPGLPFLDAYAPALLEPGLYHPDGMMIGEVFEWGSFAQSRMHAAGVVCSDCHQPHSGRLRADKDQVCQQCHAVDRFQTTAHHHHAEDGPGAQCTACHMPIRVYMGIHTRHDHGFRVPRPDLSRRLGTPNACNDCHRDRDAAWAADAVAAWYGPTRRSGDGWAVALAAGRLGSADAAPRLSALIADPAAPAIARATALRLLPPGRAAPALLAAAARDPDPLVRYGLAEAGPVLPVPQRVAALSPLLSDPLRAVRIGAARALAAVPETGLPPPVTAARDRALAEEVAAVHLNADDPTERANLGQTWLDLGRTPQAEAEFLAALRLEPSDAQAILGLTEALRRKGGEREAEQRLRAELANRPEAAVLHHALGLSLARQQRGAEALAALARAERLDPANARYAYVHAVALNSLGRPQDAYEALRAALVRHPGNRDILLLMALIARDMGAPGKARDHVEQVLALDPGDPAARQVLDSLRRR